MNTAVGFLEIQGAKGSDGVGLCSGIRLPSSPHLWWTHSMRSYLSCHLHLAREPNGFRVDSKSFLSKVTKTQSPSVKVLPWGLSVTNNQTEKLPLLSLMWASSFPLCLRSLPCKVRSHLNLWWSVFVCKYVCLFSPIPGNQNEAKLLFWME